VPNLEFQRKQAKALVRAYRAGEPEAVERAGRVLGERPGTRFVLADAQHVVARELGHRRWAELLRAAADVDETVVEPGLAYREGEPVRVRIRKRHRRYDIGDMAAAVELAGRPPGWLEAAERVVEEHWLNVNRRGVVFVPAVEGRDIEALALRVAECSLAVYEELIELRDG
jgi:hypothetical protein